jgi:glycosyltransferase involved in cell wall biosynthesis
VNIVIVSHTPHYRRDDGRIVGWGPTIRELDQLATRFDRVRHVACLYDEPAPASALPYTAKNLELVPVRPAGGEGLRGKLDALLASAGYARTILAELADADVLHIRGPANIAMIAMLVSALRRSPARRWIKYAGNWRPDGDEARSYTLQRWWLSKPWHRARVTVNGDWPDQPGWVTPFYNPSLSEADLAEGRRAAAEKPLPPPLRLLFVGRVETAKGAGRALDIVAELGRRGIEVHLDLVGDGPERADFERRARELGIAARVIFHGWMARTELGALYARAHVMLLPTTASEGWPKVLSEGMAYGAVPVAGAVSAIGQYLERFGTGRALPAEDVAGFVETIEALARDPEAWKKQSANAVAAADYFTYRYYLGAVERLFAVGPE